MNNKSRSMFESLVRVYDLKKIGNRNCFRKGNNIFAVSLSTDCIAECRQFYDDCDFLLTFNKDSWYLFPRNGLNIHKGCNRITNDGAKVHTATGDFSNALKVIV